MDLHVPPRGRRLNPGKLTEVLWHIGIGLEGFVVLVPPELPVDEVLVFKFIMEIGISDVAASLAFFSRPAFSTSMVTGIKLVWWI